MECRVSFLLLFLSLYCFCECTLLVVSSWAPSLVPYLMFASVLLNRATSPYLWPLLGFRGGESYCTLYPDSDYSYTSLITSVSCPCILKRELGLLRGLKLEIKCELPTLPPTCADAWSRIASRRSLSIPLGSLCPRRSSPSYTSGPSQSISQRTGQVPDLPATHSPSHSPLFPSPQ